MESEDPLGVVIDNERALPIRILRRDTCRTTIGMSGLCLNASEREHEPASGIAPVRTQRHDARNVECRSDFTRSPDPDPVAEIHSDQCIVHQSKSIA